jgi:site-specific DNA-cytosine methylase
MIATIGSLFTGVGGLDRGMEAGLAALGRRSRVIWQAEKDPYARAVLRRHWPTVHCYEDVHEISEHTPRPHIIGGGFPCQDLSIAGRRAGIDGERSGLWSEFVRSFRLLRPDIVFVENVPELLRYLGRVLGPLAELGYDAEWDLFDAAAVGAPHRRERLFIFAHRQGALADTNSDGCEEPGGRWPRARVSELEGDGEDVPDADDERREVAVARGGPPAVSAAPRSLGDPEGDGRKSAWADAGQGRRAPAADGAGRRWAPEPDVGRVVDGPSSRLHARIRRSRLRCLGNGAVEQQVALAFEVLGRRAGLVGA